MAFTEVDAPPSTNNFSRLLVEKLSVPMPTDSAVFARSPSIISLASVAAALYPMAVEPVAVLVAQHKGVDYPNLSGIRFAQTAIC